MVGAACLWISVRIAWQNFARLVLAHHKLRPVIAVPWSVAGSDAIAATTIAACTATIAAAADVSTNLVADLPASIVNPFHIWSQSALGILNFLSAAKFRTMNQ